MPTNGLTKILPRQKHGGIDKAVKFGGYSTLDY